MWYTTHLYTKLLSNMALNFELVQNMGNRLLIGVHHSANITPVLKVCLQYILHSTEETWKDLMSLQELSSYGKPAQHKSLQQSAPQFLDCINFPGLGYLFWIPPFGNLTVLQRSLLSLIVSKYTKYLQKSVLFPLTIFKI